MVSVDVKHHVYVVVVRVVGDGGGGEVGRIRCLIKRWLCACCCSSSGGGGGGGGSGGGGFGDGVGWVELVAVVVAVVRLGQLGFE